MQHIAKALSTSMQPLSHSAKLTLDETGEGGFSVVGKGGLKPPFAETNTPPSLRENGAEFRAQAKRIGAATFARLSGIYGAKLLDFWAKVGEVREEWDAAVAELHPKELERGLQTCRSKPFVPTLGEFMQFCRPTLDSEIAWFEAAEGLMARAHGERGRWGHPAVYRAAMQMQWEVRSGSFAQHRKRWAVLLQREFANGWGEAIPAPLPCLTAQEAPAVPPPADVREKMRAILASAGRHPKLQSVVDASASGGQVGGL